jgi:hypothetical protein
MGQGPQLHQQHGTLEEWRTAFDACLVRIKASPEEENYFDAYGQPDTEEERRAITAAIDRMGCWCVYTEVFNAAPGDPDGMWIIAGLIGFCVYDSPCDPFENAYVIGLMREALDMIPQSGEH